MQRINIKGSVNQKNIISGVVHRGGGEGGGENAIVTASQTFTYEVEELSENDDALTVVS